MKLANHHDSGSYTLLQTIPGVGKILALVMLYEIENIRRFATVQDFVSYSRLVKCAKESNGKKCGSGGTKIGNAHLKWAFSEAAVFFLKTMAQRKAIWTGFPKNTAKQKPCLSLPINWDGLSISCLRTRRSSIKRNF